MLAVATTMALAAAPLAPSFGLAATSSRGSAVSLAGRAYAPHQVLVRFRSGVSAASTQEINARLGARTLTAFHVVDGLQLVRLPASMSVPAALASYRAMSEVDFVEPNWVTHVDAADETIPNDPSFNLQWNWKNAGDHDVDATDAWDLNTGSSDVAVGLIDTGVQIDPHLHVDLAANIWSNQAECSGVPGVDDEGDGYVDDCHGIDTINHDSDPNDDYNHGTHVAGIMGAVGNNAVGVTGLNWHLTIVPCKSHDSTGNGTNASLLECLQYMQDWKARGLNIVATNNSYGGCNEACDFSQSLYDAIQGQMKSGILYVASAGNDTANNDLVPKYPTNYYLPNVVGVAATDSNDNLAFFSNYGKHTVSVAAPGNLVYSTLFTDSYGYESGTSMAAPGVTGLAAFIAASDPSLDWRGIRNLIMSSGDVVTGAQNTITKRRINAFGSLTCTNAAVSGPLRPLPQVSGGAQTVSALNIDCAAPAGGLSVHVSPGGRLLKLTDDGRLSDLAGADGVYSAFWTPCQPGSYTLSYSNGMTDTITVSGATPCIVSTPRSGQAGSTVKVRGQGFAANEAITLMFDSIAVGNATSNASGVFTAQITVPASAHIGRHEIFATGATLLLTSETPFRVGQ